MLTPICRLCFGLMVASAGLAGALAARNDWAEGIPGQRLRLVVTTPDGTNGWSARGSFYYSIPQDNPLAGTTPIGTYCCHADQQGKSARPRLFRSRSARATRERAGWPNPAALE